MLCYVVVMCYVVMCYVVMCYVMLCYVMLCYDVLCYVMLCYVMLCCDVLCYVMSCYVVMCYAELPTLTVSPCDRRSCMFSHALTPHIQFVTQKKIILVTPDKISLQGFLKSWQLWLCNVRLCYIILSYVMLCYALFCYV